MPSWNIHLAIGKKLSNIYDVNKNTFLFASLIPDYKKEFRHYMHFYGEEKYTGFTKAYIIDYKKFVETYKNNIDNSLILGYYAHILADFFYNTRFFKDKIVHDELGEVIGVKNFNNFLYTLDMMDVKNIKHDDLESYGAFLYKNGEVDLPKYDESLLSDIKLLKQRLFDEEYIKERIDYLNKEFIDYYSNLKIDQYKLYTKREYDFLYDDCINFIIKMFDELSIKKR